MPRSTPNTPPVVLVSLGMPPGSASCAGNIDAAPPHEVCTAHLPRWVYQHCVLTRTHYQTADDTAFQCVEGGAIQSSSTSRCVHHSRHHRLAQLRAGGLPIAGLHRTDGFCGPGSGTHRELRPRAKVLARLPVHPMVSSAGVGDVLSPAHLCNPSVLPR